MWKVSVGFVVHRLALFLIALVALNFALSKKSHSSGFKIHSLSALLHEFVIRIEQGPEARFLLNAEEKPPKEIFSHTSSLFLWLGRYLHSFTGMRVGLLVLLLSNFFFYAFTWEIYTAATRIGLPEVAERTALLATFWITSYEMAIGSELSLTCLLMALTLRSAMDNQWLLSGLALGALALTEPLSVALIPMLALIFWFFQQHVQAVQVIRRLVYFLVPIGAVVASKWEEFAQVPALLRGSAMLQLSQAVKAGDVVRMTIAHSTLGQTLTLLFFSVSGIIAIFSNGVFLYRLVPIYAWITVLLFSSYGMIASRALLAGMTLQGLASASAPVVIRVILLMLFLFSGVEVWQIFTAA